MNRYDWMTALCPLQAKRIEHKVQSELRIKKGTAPDFHL